MSLEDDGFRCSLGLCRDPSGMVVQRVYQMDGKSSTCPFLPHLAMHAATKWTLFYYG